MTNDARRSWRERIAWGALFVVFMPVLVDLARHVTTNAWALYALAFPPLTFLAARSTPPGPSRLVPALVAVAVGMGIEAVALASGTLRLGRIGFVLCVAALLLLEGRFRMRIAVLLALCVPIPHWILERTTPGFLVRIADALAALDRASGTPAVALGASVERASGLLLLESADAGLTTAILAFGLAWFASTRREMSLARTAAISMATALIGVAVHFVATLVVFHMGDGTDVDSQRMIRDAIAYGVLVGLVVGLFRLPMLRTRQARPT